MGKVTKSVIEDLAYQLKRVGILTHAYNNGSMPEDVAAENEYNDLNDPEVVLDWVISNVENVLAEHDPTFDFDKFREQCSYKPDKLM